MSKGVTFYKLLLCLLKNKCQNVSLHVANKFNDCLARYPYGNENYLQIIL